MDEEDKWLNMNMEKEGSKRRMERSARIEKQDKRVKEVKKGWKEEMQE